MNDQYLRNHCIGYLYLLNIYVSPYAYAYVYLMLQFSTRKEREVAAARKRTTHQHRRARPLRERATRNRPSGTSGRSAIDPIQKVTPAQIPTRIPATVVEGETRASTSTSGERSTNHPNTNTRRAVNTGAEGKTEADLGRRRRFGFSPGARSMHGTSRMHTL